MVRGHSQFICQSCGTISHKWSGKCEECEAWNTLTEEHINASPPLGRHLKQDKQQGKKMTFTPLSGKIKNPPRNQTGIGEFDRVCGGGLVAGSALLLGGDPGIGKSTILLQVAATLANKKKNVIYISGEEAIAQLRMRAERLKLEDAPIKLASETNATDIITTLKADTPPDLVIIDSIQTIWLPMIESAPGTVSQVRASAQELIHYAKSSGTTLILVGHVTKEGQIAGPRILEHMVDTVIYFEGDRHHHFRILRAVKNRFGATDEMGVFEMHATGLSEVTNPSSLFLESCNDNVAGTAIFAAIEGTRPVLVEIQALIAPSSFATPRRAVVGWDNNRLSMILAVLESRSGINFSGRDVFLNIAGGLRIYDTAADIAVATALISAYHNHPIPHNTVSFGEISLSGAIRSVSQHNARLKEAAKLGFTKAMTPPYNGNIKASLQVNEMTHLRDLITLLT